MMKEVLLLAHENENDERELMPDENIDTLKDACQNLNLTVIKTYTQQTIYIMILNIISSPIFQLYYGAMLVITRAKTI